MSPITAWRKLPAKVRAAVINTMEFEADCADDKHEVGFRIAARVLRAAAPRKRKRRRT